MLMRLATAIVCVCAVTFMLRFLVALLKEGMSLPSRAVNIYFAKFNPSRKRGELIFMNPTKREKSAMATGKRAALLIVAATLLPSPLRAQQITADASGSNESAKQQSTAGGEQIPPAIAKELDAMKQRIEQLEAELKEHKVEGQTTAAVQAANATSSAAMPPTASVPAASVAPPVTSLVETSNSAEKTPAKEEPFAFADWTW